MSYYRGPKLDVSNFQRESDGTITVKVCDSINREKLMNYKHVFCGLIVLKMLNGGRDH